MYTTQQTDRLDSTSEISLNAIKEKAKTISEKFDPEKIILFGSYASGTPTPDSDVDLLVIMETERPTWDLAVEILASLKHSFPIDVVVRTPKEIKTRLKQGDFFVMEIMEQGKVIYERTRL